jgi:hypothetical protein
VIRSHTIYTDLAVFTISCFFDRDEPYKIQVGAAATSAPPLSKNRETLVQSCRDAIMLLQVNNVVLATRYLFKIKNLSGEIALISLHLNDFGS